MLNPLPDDKILCLTKLKAFADDKLNVTQNVKVVFHRIENIEGKKENAGASIFFFSHSVFKRLFSPVRQKSALCGKGLRNYNVSKLSLCRVSFILYGFVRELLITPVFKKESTTN